VPEHIPSDPRTRPRNWGEEKRASLLLYQRGLGGFLWVNSTGGIPQGIPLKGMSLLSVGGVSIAFCSASVGRSAWPCPRPTHGPCPEDSHGKPLCNPMALSRAIRTARPWIFSRRATRGPCSSFRAPVTNSKEKPRTNPRPASYALQDDLHPCSTGLGSNQASLSRNLRP